MSKPNPRLGMVGLVRILALLRDQPLSARQLSTVGGIAPSTAFKIIPQLHRAGLLCLESERIFFKTWAPVYAHRPGQADATLAKAKPLRFTRWTENVLAFAHVMRELEAPTTRIEVADATGLTRRTALLTVNALHAHGLAHIAGWTRPQNSPGVWAAQFKAGPGTDKPRPKRMTQAQYERRKYHKAKRAQPLKVLHMLGSARASVEIKQ